MKDSPFAIQVSGIKPREKYIYGRSSHNKKFEGGSGGETCKVFSPAAGGKSLKQKASQTSQRLVEDNRFKLQFA